MGAALSFALPLTACSSPVSGPNVTSSRTAPAASSDIAGGPLQTPPLAAPVLPPEALTFAVADHPELNFGTAEDGLPSIRDFCFSGDGTLLLLQMSGTIYEYDFKGTLLGTYDLHLSDRGLTAFQIAAGPDGIFYLLDGHNNAVITAGRDAVRNVSTVDFCDVGVFGYFGCDDGGNLIVSAFDMEAGCYFTSPLDVSGPEAVPGPRWTGRPLTGDLTVQPRLLGDSPYASSAKDIRISVYSGGTLIEQFVLTSAAEDSSIAGLAIYGLMEGDYFGKLFAFVPNSSTGNEELVQTFLRVDPKEKSILAGVSQITGDETIRSFAGDSYFMAHAGDTITIGQLRSACSGWTATDTCRFAADSDD